MKTFTSFFCMLFIMAAIQSSAQPLRKMQESKNFYDIQAYYETLFKDFQNKKETSTSPSGEPEESDQDNSWKIFKRWENFYQPRVYPSGEMNYEQNIFEEYQKIKAEKSNTRDNPTNENW